MSLISFDKLTHWSDPNTPTLPEQSTEFIIEVEAGDVSPAVALETAEKSFKVMLNIGEMLSILLDRVGAVNLISRVSVLLSVGELKDSSRDVRNETERSDDFYHSLLQLIPRDIVLRYLQK